KILVKVAERLPESLLDVIKKEEERLLEPNNEIDVRWRLLNGKVVLLKLGHCFGGRVNVS
ncbi:hypothetical protein SESBI_49027, partial [Sesbania bispinosa]